MWISIKQKPPKYNISYLFRYKNEMAVCRRVKDELGDIYVINGTEVFPIYMEVTHYMPFQKH